MPANNRTCRDCKHFEAGSALTRDVGQCRKNPPKVIALPARDGIALQGTFPPVSPDAYCGAYEPATITH